MQLNKTLTNKATSLLKTLVGRKIECFARDPVYAGIPSYGYIGIQIEGRRYQFECLCEELPFFGINEDVAILNFRQIDDAPFASFLEGVEPVEIESGETITQITVINDTVEQDDFHFEYTFGILIETTGKTYLIHKDVWFSEHLTLALARKERPNCPTIQQLWDDPEMGKPMLKRTESVLE